MRFVTLAFSTALLLAGPLPAQEHTHPEAPAPSSGAPATLDTGRLDRSDELLRSIRAAAGERNTAALRSAADDYVTSISEVWDEVGRLQRSEGAEPPELLDAGRRVALQAMVLDTLARTVPRGMCKDVKRALAAADGLLGTLARGRSSSEPRVERDGQGHTHSTQGSSCGHH